MKTGSWMETNGAAQGLSVFTVLKAIRRRKLYLLMPVLLLTAGAGIYALHLPERFRAEALIAAEPVIPAHYLTDRVDAATAVNVQDQLRAVRDAIQHSGARNGYTRIQAVRSRAKAGAWASAGGDEVQNPGAG